MSGPISLDEAISNATASRDHYKHLAGHEVAEAEADGMVQALRDVRDGLIVHPDTVRAERATQALREVTDVRL